MVEMLNSVNFIERWERYERVRRNPLGELRTLYLSESKWRRISRENRKRLLKFFRKSFYVDRYVANIVNNVKLHTKTKEEEKECLEALGDALLDIYESYGW